MPAWGGPASQRRVLHPHPLGSASRAESRRVVRPASTSRRRRQRSLPQIVQLADIGRSGLGTYDDFMADFSAEFHDLRSAPAALRACLDADSYVESQALAERLLEADSLGVIYPSVRHAGGTCIACFRPALVANVTRGKTYRFTWDGTPEPSITIGR